MATISYVYDKDGNLTSQTDSAGTTSYTYDGLDRLTAETFPNATSSTMTYDPAGNLTGLNDGGGTVSYAYDKANQLTAVTDPGASKPFVTFAYNNDGQLLRTIYASGASQINTYNAIDQLASVTDNYKTAGGTIAHLSNTVNYTNAANHPGSLIQAITDQANTTTTYTYDALDRLTDAKTANSGGTTTADYAYTLDPAGNITQLTASGSTIPNQTTSYAYNPGNETCWLDTGASTAGCAAPPAGANTYTYDPNGNQTSNGNDFTATYNALDQTTSVTAGGTTTNYSYLGQGQAQLITDCTTTLHNDPLGVAAQTTNGTTTYYEHAINGTPIEERTPTATYNYLYDATGNVIALTDSTGHLANHYTYTPYGTQTTTTSTTPNPFGYQAGYTTTTGLIHYGARYLDPTDARFTQQDPLNNIGSLTQADRYAYAGDDPINNTDPLGESFWGEVFRGADTLMTAGETVAFTGANLVAAAGCEAATAGWGTVACAVPAAAAVTTLAGGTYLTIKEGTEFVHGLSR